jgi:hypothetical protein
MIPSDSVGRCLDAFDAVRAFWPMVQIEIGSCGQEPSGGRTRSEPCPGRDGHWKGE